ncbi:tyrosine-type recombinase/integrase [bacterium]|nr:tyrosine-type recombinase/integrase [bacterium]
MPDPLPVNRGSRRLSKPTIDALPTESNPYRIHDAKVSSLAVVVNPNGSKRLSILSQDSAGELSLKDIGSFRRTQVGHARALARRATQPESVSRRPDTDRLQHEPVRRLAQCFLDEHVSTLKPITGYYYAGSLRRTLKVFGEREICSIEPHEIAHWSFELATRAPGTADTDTAVLRSMFRYAGESGWLPPDHVNPADGIKRHSRKYVAQPFSLEELLSIGAVLNKADGDDLVLAHIIWFMGYTGCRTGEVRDLRWSSVHNDRLVLAEAKRGRCEVDLNEAAREIICRRRKAARSDDEFVFPGRRSTSGDVAVSGSMMSNYWRRIKQVARLGKHRRLYDMRHTFASQGVMIGLTDAQVTSLLRHRNVSSADRYIYVSDPFTQDAAENVAAEVSRLMGDTLPWRPTSECKWIRWAMNVWGDRDGTQGNKW